MPDPSTLAKKDLKKLIEAALDNLAPSLEVWVMEISGEDPARAAELVLKMAEYVTPKLARKEVTGDGGGPVTIEVVSLALAPPPPPLPAAQPVIDVTPAPIVPPPALALVPPPPDPSPESEAEAAYGDPSLDDLL